MEPRTDPQLTGLILVLARAVSFGALIMTEAVLYVRKGGHARRWPGDVDVALVAGAIVIALSFLWH